MIKRTCVLALLSAGLLATGATAASAAVLQGDYLLQGSRENSFGSLPALTDDGGTNSFATDTVDGVSRQVLAFAAGSGVRIGSAGNPISSYVDGSSYSIAVTFRFDTISNFRSLFDMHELASDHHLYIHNGHTDYFNFSGDGADSLAANTYGTVVFSEGSNIAETFLNGVSQTTTDDGGEAALHNFAEFFRDNTSGGAGGEESAGAVARIRVWDGALTDSEVAALTPLGADDDPCASAAAIKGTAAGETLNGTPGTDIICGFGGNDRINGGGGSDVIYGGDGADVLKGGPGSDIMSGGNGPDTLDGGTGGDHMAGNRGVDIVTYPTTKPVTINLNSNGASDGAAGEGDDVGQDVETAFGGSGNDTLIGNDFDNTLRGGPGDDLIIGGLGHDVLAGDAGFDHLDGTNDLTSDYIKCGADGGTESHDDGDTVLGCTPAA